MKCWGFGMQSYIVYLGSYSNGGRCSTADPQTVRRSHQDLLSLLKSNVALDDQLIYSYTKIFNGFAAVLHEEEAKELAKNRDVIAVFESRSRNLQTTRSWEFLGLEHNGIVPNGSIWSKAKFGEDIIIANLDSGVWPESKSFSDEGFGPIPKKFKGHCENEHDPKFQRNRKLIGARYFYKGFAQPLRLHNLTFSNTMSPRDTEGHGTHTLSTAGGNFVHGANYLHGFANGTAKGGSPRARVVAYKTCWPRPPNMDQIGSCDDADVLAGYEAVIDDDIDIISFSLGGGTVDYFEDVISIGSFHAVKNGITVVASAGNQGPEVGTVANVSPWILTVAASSLDRVY